MGELRLPDVSHLCQTINFIRLHTGKMITEIKTSSKLLIPDWEPFHQEDINHFIRSIPQGVEKCVDLREVSTPDWNFLMNDKEIVF